jgi:hypothetical protein
MSRKKLVPPHIGPLIRVKGDLITDPAEQAALDRMRKRVRAKQRGQAATSGRQRGTTALRAAGKKES